MTLFHLYELIRIAERIKRRGGGWKWSCRILRYYSSIYTEEIIIEPIPVVTRSKA